MKQAEIFKVGDRYLLAEGIVSSRLCTWGEMNSLSDTEEVSQKDNVMSPSLQDLEIVNSYDNIQDALEQKARRNMELVQIHRDKTKDE